MSTKVKLISRRLANYCGIKKGQTITVEKHLAPQYIVHGFVEVEQDEINKNAELEKLKAQAAQRAKQDAQAEEKKKVAEEAQKQLDAEHAKANENAEDKVSDLLNEIDSEDAENEEALREKYIEALKLAGENVPHNIGFKKLEQRFNAL